MKPFLTVITFFVSTFLHAQIFASPQRFSEVVYGQPKADSSDYRLPTNVIPLEYAILLQPNFLDDTFSGYINIRVNVVEETSSITFHAAEIQFEETTVLNSQGRNIPIVEETDDEERQFRILQFQDNLPVGTYDLWISYKGVINEERRGVYKSSYTTTENVIKYLAATQFEATYARYAFPCFDEPALKATFSVSIVREADYNSISNMPLKETTSIDDTHLMDTFETSPKMSTYLVAFVVSDFRYDEEDIHRIYSTPEHLSSGDTSFALQVSIPAMAALEEYSGISYPLPKLYQIAVPDICGATSNWGLVIHSESGLLHDQTKSTLEQKQTTELVIVHEFAHQWFSNLVGPSWWSYSWLSEGFASFLQYEIGGKLKPARRLPEQHVVTTIQLALDADSLTTARPLTQDVRTPTDILNLFDVAAHAKAGAVLRMLQHAIGEEAFRKGVTTYLTTMTHIAAISNDLWNSIQQTLDSDYPDLLPDDITVPKIMETWENQAGYPVLLVSRDYETGGVTLTQERLLPQDNNDIEVSRWYIPFNYAISKDLNFEDATATHWLLPDSDNSLDINLEASDFIIANKQYGSYYRTNYDMQNWKLIAAYLNTDNFENIPPVTRAGLINDAFVLARYNRITYGTALELTQYLHRETDYIPLKSFFNSFISFNELLNGLENYYLLENMFANSLDTAVEHLLTEADQDLDEDEEYLNILNRKQVISWACMFGNKRCRESTTESLAAISSISLDLRDAVLCGGLRGASESVWRDVYQNSLEEQDSSLKSSLKMALACSENEDILNWYVEDALSSSSSVLPDILMSGNYGLRYSFDYLQSNIEKIFEALGTDETADIITTVANTLTQPHQLEKLQELRTNNNIEELGDAFDQAVSLTEANVKITDDFRENVISWINTLDLGDDEDDGAYTQTVAVSVLIFVGLVQLIL